MLTWLSNDVARCDGMLIDGDWREGCETCLRRTALAPEPETTARVVPEAIVAFECVYLLDPLDAMRAGIDLWSAP